MVKRAQTGIGALLIFLATIVVAVLAAVVFITTATSLQQKAFSVGSEAKERVAATIDVESITGYKGTGFVPYDGTTVDRYVDRIAIVIKLAPGAEPIKLDDEATTIQILTPVWQALAVRLGGFAVSNSTGETWPSVYYDTSFNSTINATAEMFYLWINQSVNRDTIWEVFSPGEVYTLVIPLDSSSGHVIPEEEEVTFKFLSRTGMSTIVKFKAPNVIKDPIVMLYP